MTKLQKENAIHVDMKKGVWLHVYKLPNEYASYLPEECDYRLEIDGYDFALTKNQFETLHDARIQVWDDGAKAERERIIRLLERDLDVLPEFARAIELIKGEQK